MAAKKGGGDDEDDGEDKAPKKTVKQQKEDVHQALERQRAYFALIDAHTLIIEKI